MNRYVIMKKHSGNLRWLVTAAVLGLCAGCSTAARAQASSPGQSSALQDPTVADLYTKARAIWPQVLSGELLQWPAVAHEWPCVVSELQARRWIGGLALEVGEFTEADKRLMRKVDGQLAQPLDSVRISNLRIAPISGNCVDGKPHGMFDYMMDFTRTDVLPGSTPLSSTYRTRTKVMIEQGERVRGQTKVLLQQMTKFEGLGADGKPLRVGLATNLMLDARTSDTEYYLVALWRMPGQTPGTMFTFPVAPNTVEDQSFMGDKLVARSRQRNNQPHGASLFYDERGEHVMTTCYDNGVKLATTNCSLP